jgi:hypothetical protein
MAGLYEGPTHGKQTDPWRFELTATSHTCLRPRAARRSRGRRCFTLCQRLHASATTTIQSGNRRPSRHPGRNTEHRLQCKPEGRWHNVALHSLRRARVGKRLQRAPEDSDYDSIACGVGRPGAHIRSGDAATSEGPRTIRPSGLTHNVLGEGPPERRSRRGNREAQLLGGPSRPAG